VPPTIRHGTGPRVLHAVEVIRGGTATYLQTIAPSQFAALSSRNVYFLVPERNRRDLAGIDAENMRMFRYPGRSLSGLVAYLTALRKAVRDIMPDIIHAHGTFPGLYVRLYALLLGARRRPRIVYCAHGWSFQRRESKYKLWLYTLVERFLSRYCDAIITISRSEIDAAIAAGLPAHRLSLIYNGLPVIPAGAPARTIRPAKIALLFVGRLDVQKGFDILLDCFHDLDRERYHLYVAGEAVHSGEDITTRLGAVPPNVVFLGWQTPEQLSALYAGVDAVVMPSRWEGFGFVAVEAMRAGCAVIASRVGGLLEIVRHGRTGLLFEIDKPEQLRGILRGVTRSGLRELGLEGRRRFVAEFAADRMSTELLALYDAVCGTAPSLTVQDSRETA